MLFSIARRVTKGALVSSSLHLARSTPLSLLPSPAVRVAHRSFTPARRTSADPSSSSEPVLPVTAAASEPDLASAASSNPPPLPAPLFLRMPSIDGVGKCRLLRWLVRPGEPFESGDVLAEIDSDLAVIEYKAQSDGMIALTRTAPGERIVDDQVLALQVASPEELPNAERWNAYMKAIEIKDKKELEEHEAREEEQAKEELKREQQQQQQQELQRASSAKNSSKPGETG
jgi:biotin carboxyl carrier protein